MRVYQFHHPRSRDIRFSSASLEGNLPNCRNGNHFLVGDPTLFNDYFVGSPAFEVPPLGAAFDGAGAFELPAGGIALLGSVFDG